MVALSKVGTRGFLRKPSRGWGSCWRRCSCSGMRSLLWRSKLSAMGRSTISISRPAGGKPAGCSWWPHRSERMRRTYFPANGDLWFTWLMASWGGDRLARWARRRFSFWPGSRPFGCGQDARGRRSASLVATCWFASSTPFSLYSVRAERRHDLHGRVHDRGLFLSSGIPEKEAPPRCALGRLAAGECARDQGGRGRFRSAAARRSRPRRFSSRQDAGSNQVPPCAVVLLVPLFTGGYWYVCNCCSGQSTVSARGSGDRSSCSPRLVSAGRDAVQPILHSFRRLAGAGDTLLAVLDPRLVPFWVAAIALGWLFAGGGGALRRSWGARARAPGRHRACGWDDGFSRSGSWGS